MIDFKSDNIQKLIGNGGQSNLSSSILEIDNQLDIEFGIDYKQTESLVSSCNEDIYSGIESAALLTSYLDYYQIFADLEREEGKSKSIVDVGAGYCRGSLLASSVTSTVQCISVEIEANRVNAARESLPHEFRSTIIQADVLDPAYQLPVADAYFLYIPTGSLLNSFLRKSIEQNICATLYVIESHGDFNEILNLYSDFITELPSELMCSLPRHDSSIRKYEMKPSLLNREAYLSLSKNQKLDAAILPLWMIKYFDQTNLFYEFESKNIGAENYHSWNASTEKSHLIRYNNQMALQIYSPFKIIQVNGMDKIISVREQ